MQAITFLSTLALALAAAPSFTEAARVEVAASIRVCQPAAISWSGAQGQVFLSAVIGTDPAVTAEGQLKQFPVQNGASGSYAWTVNVQPGTVLTFIINDGTGVPNYSSQITVAGENTCNAGATFAADDDEDSSSSAPAGTSSAAATTPAATSAGATPTRASVSNSVSNSVSRSASSIAASSTGTPGAAGSLRSFNGMAIGAGAALVGAAVALF